ncbi:hypothetical protein DFJ73DRAFT_960152, partial [Zopfochytrium polystomum]
HFHWVHRTTCPCFHRSKQNLPPPTQHHHARPKPSLLSSSGTGLKRKFNAECYSRFREQTASAVTILLCLQCGSRPYLGRLERKVQDNCSSR